MKERNERRLVSGYRLEFSEYSANNLFTGEILVSGYSSSKPHVR